MTTGASPKLCDLVAEYVSFTRSIYRSREPNNIRSALARLSLVSSDYPSIRDAAVALAQDDELTIGYRRSCIKRWRRFLSWCVEYEHADAELLVRFQALRLNYTPSQVDPHRLNIDQIILDLPLILDRLPAYARDAVQVLSITGARPCEVLGLRNADIDTTHIPWIAHLQHHKSAHRGCARSIVFATRAMQIIQRRMKPICPDDYIWAAPKDPTRPCTTNTLSQALKRAREAVGSTLTLYDLRRCAATITRARVSLDAAQALLGHQRSSTTELYARLDHSKAIQAAQALEEELGR